MFRLLQELESFALQHWFVLSEWDRSECNGEVIVKIRGSQ
jgi:hypothetical protein